MIPIVTSEIMKEQIEDIILEIKDVFINSIKYGDKTIKQLSELNQWNNKNYANSVKIHIINESIEFYNNNLDQLEILDLNYRKMCIKSIRAGGNVDTHSVQIMHMMKRLTDLKNDLKSLI